MNKFVTLITPISINTTISAVIDNPNDIDLYTITLDEPTVIRYTLNTPSNLNYQMDYYSGDGGIRIKDNLISLTKGTHVFCINSVDGSCSESNSYNICFKKIAKAAYDTSAVRFACSESKGIVFHFDANRTKFYINGNLIDFSYSYKKSLSNSAGTQSYNIQLRKTQNINVCFYQTEGTDLSAELQQAIPQIVRYRSSNLTGITNRDVLMLSVFDTSSPCYSIHNVCSGAYKDNTLWDDLNYCNIFVDPNTGKVIDIAWYNYFYEVGNYKLSYSTIGSLDYYYPYYNGIDPE